MLLIERLFALAPSARALFGEPDAGQRAAMMEAIGSVIDGLDEPRRLEPALFAIGRRLAARGVTAAHHEAFGEALLWAVGHAVGSRFTPETKDAWKRSCAYAFGLMRRMRAAA
jgi:hemoglobin-like flavoprotein